MRFLTARRIGQAVFLLAFLALLLGTREPLREWVPVESFLRIDPLLGLSGMLSGRTLLLAFLPALALVLLTPLLGRFFCGWVCPLGTTIDVFDRLALRRRRPAAAQPVWARGKYVTLAAGLVLAAFGVQVVGWIDPLCIATRFYGGVLLPTLSALCGLVLEGLETAGATRAADAVQDAMSGAGLPPPGNPVPGLLLIHAAILVAVLALSLVRKRFWCRSLCPLGGLLALLSRRRLLGPVFTEGCTSCSRCDRACPTGAISPVAADDESFRDERASDPGECTQCMSCLPACREGGIALARIRRRPSRPELVPGRRPFLRAAVGGALAAPLLALDASAGPADARAIRPPGAGDESRFLDLCVRCGQCTRACPTGGLRSTGLDGGLEGLFTPRLVPRAGSGGGHCEYECNLCGRICPTGAIPALSLAEKQRAKIGLARFDRDRCLPWARGIDCIVCEEHCPTPDKAILARVEVVKDDRGREVELHLPRVDEDRCIGCGTCESVCPLPGPAAIRVERRGDVAGG